MKAKITPEAWEFFRSLVINPIRRPISSCYEHLYFEAKKQGWEIPSCSSLRRLIRPELDAMKIKTHRKVSSPDRTLARGETS